MNRAVQDAYDKALSAFSDVARHLSSEEYGELLEEFSAQINGLLDAHEEESGPEE